MRAATRQASSPSNPRAESLGEWLAEAEPIEEVESYALRFLSIDGFGQQVQGAPGKDRAPHGRRCELGAGTGQHAAGGCGPRRWEQRFSGRNAQGREHTLTEGWNQQAGIGEPFADAGTIFFRQAREIGGLGRAQKGFAPRPGLAKNRLRS